MSDQRRSLDEWYELITRCRQSGLTDANWCYQNGICRQSFYTAIKRLRQRSVDIPKRSSIDIDHLPRMKQDVVQVSILPDAPVPPAEMPSMVPTHFDNSHTIKITFHDATIEVCNDADPVLLSKTIHLLRSMS